MNNQLWKKIPDDLGNIILDILHYKCHGCLRQIKFSNFYKKQNKFFYCSKDCYYFI